jgi:seryl-tRNA synthetase
MLDPARLDDVLRRGPAAVKLAEEFRAIDGQRKAAQSELDGLRARRNEESDRMAKVADKKSAEFTQARATLKVLSDQIKQGEVLLKDLEARAEEQQLYLPNAPHPSVPDGADETGNKLVETWGDRPAYEFKPRDHVDLGVSLGILDFERAAKLSGSRFTVVKARARRSSARS